MARKDSGKQSSVQHKPADTPPNRVVPEAPGRRRARRAEGASDTTDLPSGAAKPAPRGRRQPASPPAAEESSAVLGNSGPPLEPPAESESETENVPNSVLEDAVLAEQRAYASSVPPLSRARRRERQRLPHGNALGILIERHFTDPTSPCRSYSDLERRSGISREALSRYVTARPDRRRSPTIDTLVAIADAMHLSLEAVSRAAAASVHGVIPPSEEEQHAREAILSTLVAGLTDEQFSAVVELLRHLRPAPPAPKA